MIKKQNFVIQMIVRSMVINKRPKALSYYMTVIHFSFYALVNSTLSHHSTEKLSMIM